MNREAKRLGWLVLCAAWLVSGVAVAADAGPVRTAVVEGVQLPAWIERGGDRLPLAIGAALQPRDRVVTGEGARLLLRMPEGSLVKLGENGTLDLEAMSRTGTLKDELVQAALGVVRGAFRFTTDKLPGFVGRREVDIRISSVTAGIRGTDLWGKSDAERDIVCLIEGRISVRREGDNAFTMDQPLSFYVAPKGRAAEPVAPVDRRQLGLWAAETELEEGKGVLRRGGRWRLALLDTADERQAIALVDALVNAGYPARVFATVGAARSAAYRVRIDGFPDEAEAKVLAARLASFEGVRNPRIER